jgi:hypothetical protein
VSDGYLIALAVTVGLILATRVLIPFLPLSRWAAPMTTADAALFTAGCLGLALHCGAMFFPATVRSLPGGPEVIRVVDPLTTNSILWYAIAAALVVVALRHQHIAAPVLAGIGLCAVGYTMYDNGRLNSHLTAIFATVVLLAAILAVLVVPPRPGRRIPHPSREPSLPPA